MFFDWVAPVVKAGFATVGFPIFKAVVDTHTKADKPQQSSEGVVNKMPLSPPDSVSEFFWITKNYLKR